MEPLLAAIRYRRKCSGVISDRERGTDFHGALCGGGFLRCFGLFTEMNSSFVAIVRDEIRRFFEAKTAQRAAAIHIPLPRRVLRLFTQFVRHDSSELSIALKKIRLDRQFYCL
jgi:hypothetical protein